MQSPWKVILAFLGVFVAGAVFGGVFTLATAKRNARLNPPPVVRTEPAARPERERDKDNKVAKASNQPGIGPAMMRQLTQQLKLTDEQREKIRPLVARAAEDLQLLRQENLQKTTRVMERMHADITAWLMPEQREELENLKKQMQQRIKDEQKKRGEQQRNNPANAGDAAAKK
jgi:Spy/CpxP family protein refolding chaperone